MSKFVECETPFPDPDEIVSYLENEDSTYTDALYEFQRLADFNRILATCKTAEDIEEYIRKMETIANRLKNDIPPYDPKLKYFYFGSFYFQAKQIAQKYRSKEDIK